MCSVRYTVSGMMPMMSHVALRLGGVKHRSLHPLWKKKSIIRDRYALIEIYKGCF